MEQNSNKTGAKGILQVGDKMPDFNNLTVQRGKDSQVKGLTDLAEDYCVLYFYPKDDTPGCTSEAQQFAELHTEFAALSCPIVGVSKDPEKAHTKFVEKYSLPFPLICDPQAELAQKCGVWVEKSMYGRKYMGMQRATFLLVGQPEGGYKVIASWPKVSVKGHAQAVIDALKELNEPSETQPKV